MASFWLVAILAICSSHLSYSFILSLKKPDGTLDTEHLVGHLTLLEQTVTSFQQTLGSQNADIAVLQSEVSNLKVNQQKLDSKIFDLQKVQTGQPTGGSALQNAINTVSTEVRSLSKDVISLTANFNNLTHVYHLLSSQVNSTGVARDADFKALDQKYQTLSSQVNSTGVVRDAELTALGKKYQSLSSKVNTTGSVTQTKINALKSDLATLNSTTAITMKLMQQKYEMMLSRMNKTFLQVPDQNITATLNDVQQTLARVLVQVHGGLNDRFLLHSHVTKLNTTVSELSTKYKTASTELSVNSAKIALLDSTVLFESWIGSSNIKVSSGSILKFSDIQYNIGGGYSSSTGKFTAPVSGIYLVWTEVVKESGPYLGLYIVKGGADIGESSTTTPGNNAGCVITSVRLVAGEQVYVRTYGAQTIWPDYRSRFGGTLLYRQ